LDGFDLTQRSCYGAIYAESIRFGAAQQKVRYSTDRVMADFVIEATKQSEPQTEGGR
jgi:hypothetical protein